MLLFGEPTKKSVEVTYFEVAEQICERVAVNFIYMHMRGWMSIGRSLNLIRDSMFFLSLR